MRRLTAFTQITLDGYFADPNGDIRWAHGVEQDAEWSAFVESNAATGGVLLFGRTTYEIMASYWPTPQATVQNPKVAAGMNEAQKVVFSRTLKHVSWSNTTLATEPVETVRRMKNEPGKDMAILGSGSIVLQLTEAGVIDEYMVVIFPIVLGKGKTLFHGLAQPRTLKRTQSRAFGNGNILLCYAPPTRA